MSNAKDNRIKQLEEQLEKVREQNTELHKICQRQRDSLAAQQEAIVQLTKDGGIQERIDNLSYQMDSTLACLANLYGEQVTLEDGTQARQVKIPAEDYPGVLDRFNVSAVMEDGHYVITVAQTRITSSIPTENGMKVLSDGC